MSVDFRRNVSNIIILILDTSEKPEKIASHAKFTSDVRIFCIFHKL